MMGLNLRVVSFVFSIFLVSLISCSKDKGNNTSSNQIEGSEINEVEENYSNDFPYEILFKMTEKEDGKGFGSSLYVAEKSRNGDYIKFDNDNDYSSYGNILFFLSRYMEKYPYEPFKEFVNKTRIWYSKSTLTDEEFDELLTILPGYKEYAMNVLKNLNYYLEGEKDKITDQELYKNIDRVFYDYKPNKYTYSLQYSGYGYKGYITDQPGGGTMIAHDSGEIKNHYNSDDYIINEKAEPIQEPILILYR